MKLINLVPTSLTLLLLLSACSSAPPATGAGGIKAPAVGEPARPLALPALDGATVNLAVLHAEGPVVLVQLRGWNGYQCPLCTRQIGELVSRADQLKSHHARVLLVYPGPAETVAQYAAEFDGGKGLPPDFTLVKDADSATARAWGLRWEAEGETAYPATFVIDSGGIVRYAKISGSHGDRAKVDDVLSALDSLSTT